MFSPHTVDRIISAAELTVKSAKLITGKNREPLIRSVVKYNLGEITPGLGEEIVLETAQSIANEALSEAGRSFIREHVRHILEFGGSKAKALFLSLKGSPAAAAAVLFAALILGGIGK